MKLTWKILTALLLTVACWRAEASIMLPARIVDGDTVGLAQLDEVLVFAQHRFRNERQRQRYTRYIQNVKKTLPIARQISRELDLLNDSLVLCPSVEERTAFIDRKEKDLFSKYENRLRHLTVRQGRILIKLVARETGQTAYQHIKLLKGTSTAAFWQGVAFLFGSSLASDYDAEYDDKYLESVVLLIDKKVY